MNVKQVYTILTSVVSYMNGLDDIKIVDERGIVSLGTHVLDSSNDGSKDDFLNVLVDRIGKTVISNRAYNSPDKSLVNDSFTFGAILQKIYVYPMEAKESETWGLDNGQSLASFIIAKPTVTQSLFSSRNAWQIDVTIPDVQLKSAFTGEEQMSAFISAIFTAVDTAIAQQLEALTNLCYCEAIGELLVHKTKVNTDSIQVINLLEVYNDAHEDSPLTVTTALESLDFLKFASLQINLWSNRMTRLNGIMNTDSKKRHTPKELQRLTMLDQFALAFDSYLQADTFHNELVKLPNYVTTPYWIGSGETYDFADCSLVNVVTESGYDVEQTGVVALLSDIEALGVTIDDRRTRSQYLPNEEVTTYFNKFERGLFVDMSENMILFVIADEIATPTAHVDAQS